MQYLKDGIRSNIRFQALCEFNEKGFSGASIRSIAKKSNTSVGNIYKYFDSKEDLFEALIGTVYHKLMDYIIQFDSVELNAETDAIFYQLMENIMEIFNENNIELSILLNKSQGSKYENCKKTYIAFITRIATEKMQYDLSLQGRKLKDSFIIYLVSNSLVESISITLEKQKDGITVRNLILNLIDIFFGDITNKLDSEQI